MYKTRPLGTAAPNPPATPRALFMRHPASAGIGAALAAASTGRGPAIHCLAVTDFSGQQQLIAALLDPRCYPHPARRVRLIETHISWVLLAGPYAYKFKKAVDLGFLDFTALEARAFFCAEELRLNRRLAPHLYLDVVPIGGSHARPVLGQTPAIEYAVRMRRFASGKLLDRQLARGQVTPQHMDSLAATLGRFHRELPSAAPGSEYGTAANIRAAAAQNFEQIQPLLHADEDLDTLAVIRQLTEAEYAAQEQYFSERRRLGWVRECHGDLHLGNIVLIGGAPVPFDGIEFSAGLRWMDVMSEIAFLMMDLLYRSHAELAYRFLNAYLESTGDYAGVAVLRFYLAYRAMVRAKISAIRAAQPQQPKHDGEREMRDCSGHLALAMRCLTLHRPALIITHGLPGSGKTTFAQMALERLGAVRIRSDVERKRLFGLGALESSRAGTDIYSKEAAGQTYARLEELARAVLAAGFPVIVDAAFLRRGERDRFRAIVQDMKAPFAIASLHAPDSALRARIAHRRAHAQDASEADERVLSLLQAREEPLAADELACSAEFFDTQNSDAFPAASWTRLQALLAP